MTIGEKILQLRTAKSLSQGDLANLLDVSRQSISKWETDAAVPDLDKLLKLADLFQVTLDELVGRTSPQSQPIQRIEVVTREPRFTVQSIVGLILLGISLLFGLILLLRTQTFASLFIPLPPLVCGILCLCTKEKAGYWCLWVAAITAELIFAVSTAIIGLPYLTSILVARVLLLVVMTLVTRRAFRDEPGRHTAPWKLVSGWLVWLAAEVCLFLLLYKGFYYGTSTIGALVVYYLFHGAFSVGLAHLFVRTALYPRTARGK